MLQADDSQEQQLQLSCDHLQWKDSVDPAQDVDGKRRELCELRDFQQNDNV